MHKSFVVCVLSVPMSQVTEMQTDSKVPHLCRTQGLGGVGVYRHEAYGKTIRCYKYVDSVQTPGE